MGNRKESRTTNKTKAKNMTKLKKKEIKAKTKQSIT